MYNPAEVFRFLGRAQQSRKRTVLVTIATVTGSSTRNPGAHMVVDEDGAYAGSLSGGCVEAAVVAEALAVLADGGPRLVRYGAGSRFIDIRLPCGGSIDLLFNAVDDPNLGQCLVDLLSSRAPFQLELPKNPGTIGIKAGGDAFGCAQDAECLSISHIPPLRLAIFGQSASATKLAALADACGAETVLLSPDPVFLAQSGLEQSRCFLLKSPNADLPIAWDQWTAAVFLFHDHDWDHHFVVQALASPSFYIGAMGSHKTHAARCAILRERAVPEDRIADIAAPIGMIASMRDPETLAVSVLAQIIERYNRTFLSPVTDAKSAR